MLYESLHKDCLNEKNVGNLRFHLGCALAENRKLVKFFQNEVRKTRRLEKLLYEKHKLPFQLTPFDDDLEKEDLVENSSENNEMLQIMKKTMFGKSSEKRPSQKTASRPRNSDKVQLHAKRLCPPPQKVKGSQIETVHVHHQLSAEELAKLAVQYGYPPNSRWEELKIEDQSRDVDVVKVTYLYRIHHQHKYRLVDSRGTGKEIIVTAEGEPKIVPGSSYSPKFAVQVVCDKFLYHIPLERQRRMMEAQGLKVQVRTLYNLQALTAMHLEPVVNRIKEELLSQKSLALHMDETPWPISNKKQKDGYMWVMSNQGGSYYHFAPTRAGTVAKELLGSYKGPLCVDGYAGYNKLKKEGDLSVAHCWAHARRKFIEIEENYEKPCAMVLDLMGQLFEIEAQATSYEQLKKLRATKSAQVLRQLQMTLVHLKSEARPESALYKAVCYVCRYWDGLSLFLKDVRVPLTNNEAERTIRQSVMGRKNFHGSKTNRGAERAAQAYTLIESCKKVELDPIQYLEYAVNERIHKKMPLTPLQYATKQRS